MSADRSTFEGDLRHLLVLEELERHDNVSQRALGERLGLAASLVNRLIRELLDQGHVEIVDRAVRPFAYRLTKEGREYRQRLNHQHFRAVMSSFRRLQQRVRRRLRELEGKGVERLVMVGAGDFAEALLRDEKRHDEPREIVGLLTDDPAKLDADVEGYPVLSHTDDLEEIVEALGVDTVILALPAATEKKIRDLARRARYSGARVQRVPRLHELVRRGIGGPASRTGLSFSDVTDVTAARELHLSKNGSSTRASPPVLITGGAGYVGVHLVRRFLDEGRPVRVLDILRHGRAGLKSILDHPDLELHEGDVCNIRDIDEAMRDVDTVIALAAPVAESASEADAERTLNLSYESTKVLVEAANFYGVRRLVLASTWEVYGPGHEEVVDEDSPLGPGSLYASARVYAERILLERTKREDDTVPVILRLGNSFGLSPRMRFDLLVNRMTAQAVIEGRIEIEGGDRYRPFVHCADTAEAFLLAAKAPEFKVAREIFNVGSDRLNQPISEVARVISEQVPDAEVVDRKSAKESRNERISFEKIRRKLGFEAGRDLRVGISEMIEAIEGGDVRVSGFAAGRFSDGRVVGVETRYDY